MINSLPNLVFQNLPQVYEVVFHGNKIKSFDLRCVANLPTLRILALGWNRLQSISYTSENGTAPPLRSISSLRIYGNQLPSRYLSYFKNTLLYQMLFINNLLTQIPKNLFENAEHLNAIYLTKNGLLEIDFSYFYEHPIMTYIDARYNRITTLRNDDRTKVLTIRHILLSNNRLREIPHDICNGTTLLNINISRNQIKSVESNTFRDMTSLQTVFLTNNDIKYLATNSFSSISPLQTILLKNNLLAEIPTQLFNQIPYLLALTLDQNKIKEIPNGAFAGLKNLRNLKLQSNEIIQLRRETFKELPKLGSL
ncbi:uncharacterized protein TRIADDRAFT_61214 [Trichoplax adhaerens]|uniref:Uncharacterized protein n=1 Tax=Trichoplax adhaerens TaxID=10228 RepID=B3SAC6_TRIAD|nr:hypothetical protein TRIADDRAFT_61214 [Trichoplax adhaerens]EDV20290.1 hypothetical protein TRIADDRAFT_61214 [Trichoplax adhaerens]|eukprot:XP_002117240.1 hypothetical protein TRIADDRAFT_61214 [Trichoplax adhaerens]